MVSAISAFSSMYSTMTRIDAGNRILANNNAMAQNVAAASRQAMAFGSAGIPMQNLAAIHEREKDLMASSLRNRLLYKIASVQEEQQEKKKKKLDYLA